MTRKYKKLTKREIQYIKELSKTNSVKEIVEITGLDKSHIRYYINKNYNSLVRKRAKKKSASYKGKEYYRKYFSERRNGDPKFRKRMDENIEKNRKKRNSERIKKGLCPCGKKREDKKYKLCDSCRKKAREKYYNGKAKKSAIHKIQTNNLKKP